MIKSPLPTPSGTSGASGPQVPRAPPCPSSNTCMLGPALPESRPSGLEIRQYGNGYSVVGEQNERGGRGSEKGMLVPRAEGQEAGRSGVLFVRLQRRFWKAFFL